MLRCHYGLFDAGWFIILHSFYSPVGWFVTGTTSRGVGVLSMHGPRVIMCRLFSNYVHSSSVLVSLKENFSASSKFNINCLCFFWIHTCYP